MFICFSPGVEESFIISLLHVYLFFYQELKNSATEYNKLKEMQQEMETKEKVQEEGAQFALSMAYETLKQRYDKIRGQKEDAQKQLDDAINRLVSDKIRTDW